MPRIITHEKNHKNKLTLNYTTEKYSTI